MIKEKIPDLFESMAKKYFPGLEYKFEGFYYKNSTEIAVRVGNKNILLNEKFLNLRDDQIERVLVHELQHVQDTKDLGWNEQNESAYVFGFIFHQNFQDLYKRLEKYYAEKSEENAQLGLKLLPLPKNFKEMSELENNYASPFEILARLKGYQHYLNQVSEGVEVETLAYESIEAFEEEDLKYLKIDYRKELVSELQEKNPEIFKREESRKINVELGE